MNIVQNILFHLLKIKKGITIKILLPFEYIITWLILYANKASFTTFKSHGIPLINVSKGGSFQIGRDFRMNNRESSNPIGRFRHCSVVVGNRGKLVIGKCVGMSSTSIVCYDSITIDDCAQIGGNVVIYDTDFHSLNFKNRLKKDTDLLGRKNKSIHIGKNVFIGAHSTILKGVKIGDNSVVGACSVVTKSIPPNQIWAGNPIKFIRDLPENEN